MPYRASGTGQPPAGSVSEDRASEVSRLAAELRAGAVAAFPTETYYALGADPRSPEARSEVFRLKGRPADRRLPWIAASRAQVEAVCILPARAAALADRCWPGPVTLVLPLRSGPEEGVAVRVSSHPLARALAEALGHPVISTSANPTGSPPLTSAAAVREAFAGRGATDLRILDGGRTPGGEPSVILDLMGTSPKVLRGTFDPGLLP